ncbi:translation initiation factor IF-2-like [Molothrus ater]|uniref:translation initiation factor IF-2-like n=1 Tax=Molothrus ater TaxID=84834 RepID=UPI0023E84CE9|nr:translation initiation factor IF-2-like [Molothrus ater]
MAFFLTAPGGGKRSGGCQSETTTPGRPCGRKARRLTQRPTRRRSGWRAEAAARRGSGLGAGGSRRLSRAGRSRGSDAGGAKPPAGRPHGAERRGRGVRPVPRPRSAVPVAGARLGRGALPPADGGAPGAALLPRAGSCRSRPGRAAPGAAAVTVRRLAEAREPPSCSRVPRAAAAAAGGGGRAAGMTRLLSASVLVALSSTQTDGAASLSSKTQRWPGEWRAQGAPGWILLLAQCQESGETGEEPKRHFSS